MLHYIVALLVFCQSYYVFHDFLLQLLVEVVWSYTLYQFLDHSTPQGMHTQVLHLVFYLFKKFIQFVHNFRDLFTLQELCVDFCNIITEPLFYQFLDYVVAILIFD